ncbi:MAG: lipopolysaccharide biosynthesis protein [Acidobacteriota bacterium]
MTKTQGTLDLSRFSRNACVYAAGNVMLRMGSFLLIPLYTRALAVDQFGLLANILVLVQLMMIVMGLGSHKSFIRFFAQHEGRKRAGVLICNSLLINFLGGCLLTLLTVLCFPGWIEAVFKTHRVLHYLLPACGLALAHTLCVHAMSYYRAKNEGPKFMLASIGAFLLILGLTALFLLRLDLGIAGALMAQLISYATVTILVLADVFAKERMGCSLDQISQLLSFGVPLIFGNLADQITSASGFFFLGYLANLETVAVYSVGFKVASMVGVGLILPFQLALEPFVFANLNKPQIRATLSTLLTYLMLAFAFVAFTIALFSRQIIQLIAPAEYGGAYTLVLLLLPATVFKGVYYVGESMLHIRNKTHISGGMLVLFGLFSVFMNYGMISAWGALGAVVTYNVIVIATGLTSLFLGMKIFPIPLQKRRLLQVSLLLTFLFASVFLLRGSQPYLYYSVLPALMLTGVLGLYRTNFFSHEEKAVMRGFWQRLKTAVA